MKRRYFSIETRVCILPDGTKEKRQQLHISDSKRNRDWLLKYYNKWKLSEIDKTRFMDCSVRAITAKDAKYFLPYFDGKTQNPLYESTMFELWMDCQSPEEYYQLKNKVRVYANKHGLHDNEEYWIENIFFIYDDYKRNQYHPTIF